ncbi:MAG: DNRLRE domain-containing protein [Saprospiraceae bacterium]
MYRFLILFLALFFIISNVIAQTTRTLLATEDNTLYDPLGSPLESSNGMGDYIFTGVANGNGMRRALLKFNLTTLPDNITITDAKLTLRVSRKFDNTAYNFEVHRVTRFWTEGNSNASGAEGNGTTPADFDCTWTRNVIFPTLPDSMWNNAGGDYLPAISAITEIADEVKSTADEYDATFMGTQLIADLQFMVDNSAFNNGWIIIQENDVAVSQISPEPPRAAVRFRSVNSSPTSFTPKLELTYIEGSPLAVELKDFKLIQAADQQIAIQWSGIVVNHDYHFFLEKSTNGTDFTPLATIEKDNTNQYKFIDNQPFNGINYYRLKLLNAAGQTLAEQTQAIEINKTLPFSTQLLHQGQRSDLTLQIDAAFAQTVEIHLHDLSGKKLTTQRLVIPTGKSNQTIPLSILPAGMYMITLQSEQHRETLQWQRM